jgi:AAA15 family ATPase/GTPase
MIQQLSIKNFKSIKDLKMSCKKLNIFIGEPNSGKSNIIEALCLQSKGAIGFELNKQMFRYRTLSDLFFDFNINKPIEIKTDNRTTQLRYAVSDQGSPEHVFHFSLDTTLDKERPIKLLHNGKLKEDGSLGTTRVHFYEFKKQIEFIDGLWPFLSVPYGENLMSLLLSNSEYKKLVSSFLLSKDLRLNIKPVEKEILFSKIVGDEIYSFPYFSLSETMQRIIFYMMALESNKENILLFDEPESNTFPEYTKYLAERIAFDKTNQFFITTHNPYLLINLIEKSKPEDVNVCITSMKNFETKISVLSKKQISQVLDFNSDVFFNFNRILGL